MMRILSETSTILIFPPFFTPGVACDLSNFPTKRLGSVEQSNNYCTSTSISFPEVCMLSSLVAMKFLQSTLLSCFDMFAINIFFHMTYITIFLY